MPEHREKFLTAKQLGEILGISEKTVWNKTQLRHIPCHRLPGSSRPRYLLSEVIEEMKAGRRPRRSKARRSRTLRAVG